jgi:hypothetical protein
LEVEKYFEENKIHELFNLKSKEIYFNKKNLQEYLDHMDAHNVQESDK